MSITELNSTMSKSRISRTTGIQRSTIYSELNIIKEKKEYNTRIDSNTVSKIIEISNDRITYGHRRIWAMLRNSGIYINKTTVYKIMKKHKLTLPAYMHKTKKASKLEIAGKPNMIAETDITYIPTKIEMTYLICLKDVFSKKWYGYNYGKSCTARDAISAVIVSISNQFNGNIPDSFILRTDNGPQFISDSSNKELKLLNTKHEYIEKETPTENGDIESFHNSIKTDYIWVNEINSYSDGIKIIENAFNDYNNTRPHSTINYYPPVIFEEKWFNSSSFREEYKIYLDKLKEKRYRRYRKNKEVIKSVR